jgi:hypothetical protein
VYSQKLLLSDYNCCVKMCMALERGQQPAAAAPRRRPAQAAVGAAAQQVAPRPALASAAKRALAASPRARRKHPHRGRPPLRAVQQLQLTGDMAGIAGAFLTV